MGQGKVAVRRLKEFASDNLPSNSLLRELILTEPEEMEASAFLSKMDIWLKLAKREFG